MNISLTVPDDLVAALEQRCCAAGVSAAELIVQLLRSNVLHNESNLPALFVSAPVKALVEGIYQEDTQIADILGHGDFGLGTFNDLDGEMVVLDGRVYQLKSDGLSYDVAAEVHTPFACVNFFTPDSEEFIEDTLDYPGLLSLLERMIPSPNLIYAIRIEGLFAQVRTRSVPRQDSYRPLVEVAREQPEFDFTEIKGTMAGYWTPSFMESLTVPGYHLHFLTEDRRHGGHLLSCATRKVRIAIQHLPRLLVGLPVTLDYLTAEFTRDVQKDLNEAEH